MTDCGIYTIALWILDFRDSRARGTVGLWGCGGCSPPTFFPNVMLKQLCFRTLVVKFPGEA